MKNSKLKNIDMVRGDTLSFGFEVNGIDNLDTAFFTCKRNADDTEYLFQKRLGDGIYAAGDDKYGVRIAPEDTRIIDAGSYYYDVEIGLNGDIFTILEGRLKIVQDITTRNDTPPASETAKWGNISGELSEQLDLQDALDEKANTEDLSTVATSGSYDDLSDKPFIPSKTSDITNDSGFVVSSSLSTVATSGSYADLSNKPNLATVATSGSYTDLSNKPSIPTKTSDLTNDSSFVVSTDLSAVATSGSYTDLSNKPSIPTKTSDLTNDSNFVVSTNLATVATSGDYTDLTNKPSLATVATSGLATDLTGVLPLTNGGTGATNAADARTNLSIKSEVLWENSEGATNFYTSTGALEDAVRVGILYKLVSTGTYDDLANRVGFKYSIFPVFETLTEFQIDAIAFSNQKTEAIWLGHCMLHIYKTFAYATQSGVKKIFLDTDTAALKIINSTTASMKFFRVDKYTY